VRALLAAESAVSVPQVLHSTLATEELGHCKLNGSRSIETELFWICVGFVMTFTVRRIHNILLDSSNESSNDYLYRFLFCSVRSEMEIGVSLTNPKCKNGAIVFP
jgi:hypothetical protein